MQLWLHAGVGSALKTLMRSPNCLNRLEGTRLMDRDLAIAWHGRQVVIVHGELT